MRKGFVVYFDNINQFELLNYEQRGILFSAMCYFARDGVEPEFTDPVLTMAFSFLRGQMLRDTEKYEETCRKNAENGKKGGRPKKSESDAEKPKKTDRFYDKPKKANVNVDVDVEKNNDVDSGCCCKPAIAHTHTRTNNNNNSKKTVELSADDLTVDWVQALARSKGFIWTDTECRRFIDFNRHQGRTDDWDYAVNQWERNRPRFEKKSSYGGKKKKELTQAEIDELNDYLSLSNCFDDETEEEVEGKKEAV